MHEYSAVLVQGYMWTDAKNDAICALFVQKHRLDDKIEAINAMSV